MTKQGQDVGDGSIAIQSTGHVNVGYSAADVCMIIETLGRQIIDNYTATAKQEVDARLTEFEKRVMQKVEDKTVEPRAFADPDFQYVLRATQHTYARCSDEAIRQTLVDLIAQRSKENRRTRLSLALNEAIAKAAVLTKNEFAELALVYLVCHTRRGGIGNLPQFAEYFHTQISPLLQDISVEMASYQYIAAQACGSIEISSRDAIGIFRATYPGIFSRGFDLAQLEAHLPDGKKTTLHKSLIPCLNDETKFQFNAISKDDFIGPATACGLTEQEITNVWNLFDSTVWNGEDFLTGVEKFVPEIRQFYDLWRKSPLHSLSLTSVGIAVGYSYLVQHCDFKADLSIWIK